MAHSASHEHKEKARQKGPIRIAIITISDTRTHENDRNGIYLREVISAAGHELVAYHLVRDEPAEVEAAWDAEDSKMAQVIMLNGGTGISGRDRTFDVVESRLQKNLPGFGELFRMLSWQQIGAAAMLSRATAGVCNGQVIISTPGSPAAVELAWEKLIKPELQHMAWELTR